MVEREKCMYKRFEKNIELTLLRCYSYSSVKIIVSSVVSLIENKYQKNSELEVGYFISGGQYFNFRRFKALNSGVIIRLKKNTYN